MADFREKLDDLAGAIVEYKQAWEKHSNQLESSSEIKKAYRKLGSKLMVVLRHMLWIEEE